MIKLNDIAFIVGAALIIIPPLYDFPFGKGLYYVVAMVGVVLCSISGGSSLARIFGKGDAGEDMLKDVWRWVLSRWRRFRG